jgi:hypothetical protein
MLTTTQKNFLYSWYDIAPVKFEIIKFLYYREFALIDKKDSAKTIRMLKCHSVQHLDFILKNWIKIRQQDKLVNLYYSLAKYQYGIPNQTPKLAERDNSYWNRNHWRQMEGYDFLIDIDAGDHSEIDWAKESMITICDFFDELIVPYELRFSGCGFHIIIPFRYLPPLSRDPYEKENIYQLLAWVARHLYETKSEMIDTGIYDSRRICKVPYSLAVYDGQLYTCKPIITTTERNYFNLENYKAENQSPETFRGRGTFVFNKNGSILKLLEAVKHGKEESNTTRGL